MRLDVVFGASALTPAEINGRVVAVIDVLRASSSIAAALSNGARDLTRFVFERTLCGGLAPGAGVLEGLKTLPGVSRDEVRGYIERYGLSERYREIEEVLRRRGL